MSNNPADGNVPERLMGDPEQAAAEIDEVDGSPIAKEPVHPDLPGA